MTRTQFINELKAVLNTEDVIYMHHNKATVKNAQIVEVAVDGKPIVFTIDTTEWINNPGVKFTYADIIEKLKSNDMNVVKYDEQKILVSNIISIVPKSNEEEVKTTFKNGEKVTLKTGYTFTWNESTYIEDGKIYGFSRMLNKVHLLGYVEDLEPAEVEEVKTIEEKLEAVKGISFANLNNKYYVLKTKEEEEHHIELGYTIYPIERLKEMVLQAKNDYYADMVFVNYADTMDSIIKKEDI